MGCIKQAPLVRFDADIVCRELWMITTKYRLLIIRFDNKQFHQIAKVVGKELMPKLGLNKHMPKIILYGLQKIGREQ